ncbi:MAG TPA: hemolysin family protein [Chryseolinea sp.]
MELLIVFLLMLLNGFFAMAEIAVVSSKRIRLEAASKAKKKGARSALSLLSSPDRFFSTVQIGITLVGLLTGIYSGEHITNHLEAYLSRFEAVRYYADELAVTLVLVCITFFSLIIGELVPKRIAFANPEAVASFIAPFMITLSKISHPFVWILTRVSDLLMKIFGVKSSDGNRITEEEIKAMIRAGMQVGEVQKVEQEIMERVFLLGDKTVVDIMTPAHIMTLVNIQNSLENVKRIMGADFHSVYPVYEHERNNILGVIRVRDIFMVSTSEYFDLKKYVLPVQFFPEKTFAYEALDKFKTTRVDYGLVKTENGQLLGIATMDDILKSLVGDIIDR